MTSPVPARSNWSGVRAGLVHAYTATGAVLALLIVLAAIDGDVKQALWLGLAALVIDGTDGMLARRFDVKDRLPWFDGALLDNIVDYLTYVFAPVVLLLQTGYLPDGVAGTVLAVLPLIASSYQFCRVDAKTDDHFFLGFPSYWNVVAFYVIAVDLGTTAWPWSSWCAPRWCWCRSATSTRRGCWSCGAPRSRCPACGSWRTR